jgi:methionyl-tRNA formyltransferase
VRVVILTGSRQGAASLCLPELVAHPDVEVAMVVHCLSQFVSRWRKVRRDLRKVRQIGPFGALVGLHMRSWFQLEPTEDLEDVCRAHGVPFEVSPRTNADETVALFERAGADLGLSLGNGMIFPKVYRVPRHGMLNVHGEVLPRFQGAASVVWAIHDGVTETGFTVHEVDRKIDTGRILYQERFPIAFRETLPETVRFNCEEITRRVPPALARVVADYESLAASATVQTGGRSYTTPNLRQYVTMHRQFRRLRQAAGRDA